MSKINSKSQAREAKFEPEVRLAGGSGAKAAKQDSYAKLRRATLASLLWEDLAYESGRDNDENIAQLIPQVEPTLVADLALECRQAQKLRHIPLFIAREMARYPEYNKYLDTLLPRIITRADQLSDFVALYFKDGRQPLTAKVKKGLAAAFNNFQEYHLAKYNRAGQVKLKDVLRLCHPKPNNKEQEALFARLNKDELKTPDTWEVALSSGQDKKEVFSRLISEKKLGGLAFLRNLRNMKDANVSYDIIKEGFDNLSRNVLLPLNFYAAYKHNPEFAREIEDAMLKAYSNLDKLPGHTIFVVDVSGSMNSAISGKSEYCRMEVAAALSMLAAELCERITVYVTAGSDMKRIHKTKKVSNFRGFALCKEILDSQYKMGGGGIFTRQCLDYIKEDQKSNVPERILIFSDSQDCSSGDKTPNPFGKKNYIIDVSAHKHGVNYKGAWTAEISGFSENFLTFVAAFEGLNNKFE